jgi:lipoyl(octanoyl) transferase
MAICNYILPGIMEYSEALVLQEELLKMRYQKSINDTLILLEHSHVYTIGRNGNIENLLISESLLNEKGIKVFKTTRGGDITYHGPGQIIGYPIFDLNLHGRDIHCFMSLIQNLFLKLLKYEFGIRARIDIKYPGIWIENNKIIAFGFGIKKWITYHGFAFNVNTDLNYFSNIFPCGIRDKGVTSLQNVLGVKLEINKIIDIILRYFKEQFDYDEILRLHYD